jgi:hypothetical protein
MVLHLSSIWRFLGVSVSHLEDQSCQIAIKPQTAIAHESDISDPSLAIIPQGGSGGSEEAKEVTSVTLVGVELEVAIGQAAMGGGFAGSASISGGVSSAIPSICM